MPGERPRNAAGYPGAKPELLVPAASVFVQPLERVDLANQYNWWHLGFRRVVHAPDHDVCRPRT